MINQKLWEDLSSKMGAVFSNSPAADLERNLRAQVQGFFTRLDLVPREDFEIQRQVLLKTREKLEALEQRVALMEKTAARSRD